MIEAAGICETSRLSDDTRQLFADELTSGLRPALNQSQKCERAPIAAESKALIDLTVAPQSPSERPPIDPSEFGNNLTKACEMRDGKVMDMELSRTEQKRLTPKEMGEKLHAAYRQNDRKEMRRLTAELADALKAADKTGGRAAVDKLMQEVKGSLRIEGVVPLLRKLEGDKYLLQLVKQEWSADGQRVTNWTLISPIEVCFEKSPLKED